MRQAANGCVWCRTYLAILALRAVQSRSVYGFTPHMSNCRTCINTHTVTLHHIHVSNCRICVNTVTLHHMSNRRICINTHTHSTCHTAGSASTHTPSVSRSTAAVAALNNTQPVLHAHKDILEDLWLGINSSCSSKYAWCKVKSNVNFPSIPEIHIQTITNTLACKMKIKCIILIHEQACIQVPGHSVWPDINTSAHPDETFTALL